MLRACVLDLQIGWSLTLKVQPSTIAKAKYSKKGDIKLGKKKILHSMQGSNSSPFYFPSF